MSRTIRWPSGGFVALCLTYLGVALFFLWGFSTPDLDRVWTLHHWLKIGEIDRLDPPERQLLRDAMARHDHLARALLHGHEIGVVSAHDSGWIATPTVTILRTTKVGEGTELGLDVQTPKDLFPVKMTVKGRDWHRDLTVTEQGHQVVALPAPPSTPEIIELKIGEDGEYVDPRSLGIRISFKQP